MATTNKFDPMKLPPEIRSNLENLDGDIEKAKHAVATLKSIGVDVTMIEEKLAWGEKVRKTLLTEFK